MAELPKQDKVFSRDDVAAHNKDGDLWIIVEDKVYDMSSFQNLHPGGKKGSWYRSLLCSVRFVILLMCGSAPRRRGNGRIEKVSKVSW